MKFIAPTSMIPDITDVQVLTPEVKQKAGSPVPPRRKPSRPNHDATKIVLDNDCEVSEVRKDDESNDSSKHMDVQSADSPDEDLTVEDLERTKTLKQLRDMCTELGLPNNGKKGDLARRIKGV